MPEKKYKLNLKNNPYTTKIAPESDNNVLYDTRDHTTRRGILKAVLIELNFRSLVGKHYDKLNDETVKYKILKGAKGTKKSETIIAKMILDLIMFKKANHIVIRRYMSDHQETTVAGFSTVLKRMEAIFGGNYKKFFKLSSPQSNVPYIWFNRFGINGDISHRQEIRLISGETSDFGSQKGFNGGYCRTLHGEEPLEKVDTTKKGADLTDEFMEEKGPIIEETFLRYDTITNPPNLFQEVIMSFNSGNKYHFVVKNYVTAFIQENEETLEKFGKQEYFSTDAHGQQGTYIMLMTWKVNEFRTSNEIKMIFSLRKRNYRDYRTVYLGLDYVFSGGVLSDIWHMVKEVTDENDITFDELVFGGDWSSSKDKSGMVGLKVGYGSDEFGNKILKKVRAFDARVFDKTHGYDIQRANKLLFGVDDLLEKMEDKIERHELGVPIALLDNRDAFGIDYMSNNKYRYNFGKMVAYLPASKHDTHANSAGQLSRAFALRALIISGIGEMTPIVYELLKEEAETLEGVEEGVISDGKDDVFQMCGYSISNKIPMVTKSTGLGYN